MAYNREFINSVCSRNDFVSLIKDIAGIRMTVGTKEARGLCPFHKETVPSFFVNLERGVYYCHGCGAKGNMITFLERYLGLTFLEAVEELAKRANIPLPSSNGKCFSLNRLVQWAYEAWNHVDKAAEFLESRGIRGSLAVEYGLKIGEPVVSKLLKRALAEKANIGIAEIERAGLGHDRFANRVIFPLYSSRGFLIGLTGRALAKDCKAPKWLHTSAFSYFQRNKLLFGLNKAIGNILRTRKVVIVEGPLDALAVHQANPDIGVVAVFGSSISSEQCKLLHMANEVILAMDNDRAGISGTINSIATLLVHRKVVYVSPLPVGKDPCDVKGELPKPISWIEWLSSQYPLDLRGDIEFARRVEALIAPVGELEKEVYRKAKAILRNRRYEK